MKNFNLLIEILRFCSKKLRKKAQKLFIFDLGNILSLLRFTYNIIIKLYIYIIKKLFEYKITEIC